MTRILSDGRTGLLAAILSGAAGLNITSAAEPDQIVFTDPNRPPMELLVKTETYKEIVGLLDNASQTIPLSEIKEITHAAPPHHYATAEANHDQRQWDAAITSYERAAKDPNARDWVKQYSYYNIALCHQQKPDYPRALEAYDRLLKEFPNTRFFLDAYRGRFECLMAQGKAADAEKVINDLRSQAGSTGMPEWLPQADLMQTEPLMIQGKHAQALEIFARLASDRRPEVRLAGLRGQLRAMALLRDWARLRPLAAKVVQSESDPDALAGAYNGLGDADLAEGKAKEALWSYLRAAVQLAPQNISEVENARALYGAGAAFAKTADGMTDREQKDAYRGRAVQNFKELVNRFPDSPQAKSDAGDLKKLGAQ